MVDFNIATGPIERTQSLKDRIINSTKPGPTFPGTPIHTFEDRRDVTIPAEGEVPEVHNLLFREPLSLKQLLSQTAHELEHATTLNDRKRAVDCFVHDANAVDGYLTSYPPIPIYRHSTAELRDAQARLMHQAEQAGPCNPRANALLLLHQAIDQAIQERERPVDYSPKIILL